MSNPLPEPKPLKLSVALSDDDVQALTFWSHKIFRQMREYAAAELAAARDCHTCRHYRVMRAECHYQPCVNADRYEALPPVRLWRTT